MDRILIRFNTKWQEDTLKRTWRVLVNGVETLASEVTTEVTCKSIVEDVEGITKWHMMCFGKVHWNEHSATVRAC